MIHATFPTSGMYGVTACMLGHLGVETDDATLARSMELPCLFSYENGVFRAGTDLCTPDYLNLALLPMGYHMTSRTVSREDLCAVLNTLPLAAFSVEITPETKHCVVYVGREKAHYRFENPRMPKSTEPETLSLTTAGLCKRVEEEVTLYTLQPCPPQTVDMRAQLYRSLRVLRQYSIDVQAAWCNTYLPDQLQTFCTNYLRGLLFFGAPAITSRQIDCAR